MKYNLPLNCSEIINDEHFTLINHESTSSIYFSGIHLLPDARNQKFKESTLVAALKKIRPDIKKNILLNGVMSSPFVYREKGNDIMLIENFLIELQEQKLITGLIVFDMYLLRLLALRGNLDLKSLDIIPSINCILDSIPRINAIVTQLSEILGFQYIPKKLCLDRSLNRNLKLLKEVSEYCRASFPGVELELIANEGCMFHCHIKNTHDACIAMTPMLDAPTSNLLSYAHNTYGCLPLHEQSKFKKILTIPFLRPEDLKKVSSYVDSIKISGRKLSFKTFSNIVLAYRSEEKYESNLVEIIEAILDLKLKIFIFSDSFPDDFYEKVSSCDKNCSVCTYCDEVLKNNSQLLK